MRNTILKNLAINLIVIIISLLATWLSYSTLDVELNKKLCFWLIIVLSEIVILIYMYCAIEELKEQNNVKKEQELLLQVLPHLLFFLERKDLFTIMLNGDGELLWNFHIKKEVEGPISLYFPVSFERQESDFDEKNEYVTIVNSLLNGKKWSAKYTTKSISHKEKYPFETGYIEVSLQSEKEFNLELRIRIKGLFKNFQTKEFIFVDVPYVTEKLEVAIGASDDYGLDVVNPFFEASEGCSDNIDSPETISQVKDCYVTPTKIFWNCQYPKLGYHYRIQFRMNELK